MNCRAQLMIGLLGCLSQCGCFELQQGTERPAPPPLSASLRESFTRPDYSTVTAREIEVEMCRDYRRVRFELTAPAMPRGTNPVVFDYYQLPAKRSPVILILPIAGGARYQAEEIFARYFARHGFASIIAHRWKTPHEFDLGTVDRWLRVSVEENQMVLDWAGSRPELDNGRIGLFGISMGGIRGVLLAALDPRIKASALGLAGGDLAAILAHSTDPGIRQRREEVLRKTGWTTDEFEAKLRESIMSEPNVFATHIDPHCVLLVLGVFDHVVPFKQGWELREHLGKPETILLPTGHLTAVLAIPMIQMQSVEFFETRMGLSSRANERHDVLKKQAVARHEILNRFKPTS